MWDLSSPTRDRTHTPCLFLFIHSVIYLYQYEPINIYFILCVIIKYFVIYFVA